jgi:hypothetical protein
MGSIFDSSKEHSWPSERQRNSAAVAPTAKEFSVKVQKPTIGGCELKMSLFDELRLEIKYFMGNVCRTDW